MSTLRDDLIASLDYELKRVRHEWKTERDPRQKKILAIQILEAQNDLERAKNARKAA